MRMVLRSSVRVRSGGGRLASVRMRSGGGRQATRTARACALYQQSGESARAAQGGYVHAY
ncbi:hypothetical protein JYU34_004297 [Plutella xylostella]|uniref:Uncharacterized protein n=1 Tax=Plutella xylostella TaxID=51655 RepID=A0ABQ7QXL9_PLUXY|nr:hypothetical protein JYU34_004297 [Plutella xylostella]